MENSQQLWIIFLDIDGVIATSASGFNSFGPVFDQTAISWLNKLFHKVLCQIVVSSSWREMHSLSELIEILANLDAEVISTTPIIGPRGIEINKWLVDNTDTDKFIVIDDNVGDILPYIEKEQVIHIKNGYELGGFGKEHFEKAMVIVEKL